MEKDEVRALEFLRQYKRIKIRVGVIANLILIPSGIFGIRRLGAIDFLANIKQPNGERKYFIRWIKE